MMKKILTYTFVLILFLLSSNVYATEYYLSTTGSNANPGTEAQPWLTLEYATAAGRLVAGDTLNVKGGTYYYNESQGDYPLVACDGTGGLITIKPTMTNGVVDAVVFDLRSQSASYDQVALETSPNGKWEIYDVPTSTYRSVGTYSVFTLNAPSNSYAYGYEPVTGYQLVPYRNINDLMSTSEVWSSTTNYYCGPGIFFDTAAGPNQYKLYIRLVPSAIQTSMGYANVFGSTNPNNVPLVIYGRRPTRLITGNHIEFQDITFKNSKDILNIDTGSPYITFRRCNFKGSKHLVELFSTTNNIIFDTCTFDVGIPPWLSWEDVKTEPTRPAIELESVCIRMNEAHDVEVKNCAFRNTFDAIDMIGTTSNAPYSNNIHHNTFNTRDDCVQLGTNAYNTEFAYNKCYPVFTSISWDSTSGVAAPDGTGTVYIHHNVIDTSQKTFVHRSKIPTNSHMETHRPFGAHGGSGYSTGYLVSWKFYNNTLIFGKDDYSLNGVGWENRFNVRSSTYPFECYNNIVWQKDDWYGGFSYTMNDGSQVMDGNIYYRSAASPVNQLFSTMLPGNLGFANLSTFQGTSTTGTLEDNSREANPQLDATYHPALTSIANYGGVDISAKGWPGCTDTFIGAFPAYRILIMKGR